MDTWQKAHSPATNASKRVCSRTHAHAANTHTHSRFFLNLVLKYNSEMFTSSGASDDNASSSCWHAIATQFPQNWPYSRKTNQHGAVNLNNHVECLDFVAVCPVLLHTLHGSNHWKHGSTALRVMGSVSTDVACVWRSCAENSAQWHARRQSTSLRP